MVTRTFTWGTSDDTGMSGWILDGMEGFDPSFGLAVAHDCLEHFNSTDPSVEHEMQAFGSIMYIRGDNGFWDRDRVVQRPAGVSSYAHAVGDELAEILVKAGWEIRDCKDIPLDEEQEEHFRGIWEGFKGAIPEAWDCWRYGEEEPSEDELRAMLAKSLAWIRKGYRKAARRWAQFNQWDLGEMFNDLMQRVESFPGERYDGQRLRVRFSTTGYDLEVAVAQYKGAPFQTRGHYDF